MAVGAGHKWAQKAVKKMKKKGTVGSLTAAAHHEGYSSPLEFAQHEKASPNASTKLKRKANFALNLNK